MATKTFLHLIRSLDNGGCENTLLRTLPVLNTQTTNQHHIIITIRHPGKLGTIFGKQGVTVVAVNQRNWFDIAGYIRLIKLLKKYQPVIIITYLIHADIIGRVIIQPLLGIRVIPFLRTTYNHPRYRLARLFERLSKPFIHQYLANSEAVKQFYVMRIGVMPKKIAVTPNGIDTEYFDSIVPDSHLRNSLGITPNDYVIICIANLHPYKGHKYLLEAFEKVFSHYPSIRLLIAGDGKERQNLLEQITTYQSKNHIHFLGQRSDVPQLLKISQLFVLPTLFEGMSNAIMEAMAAGTPIITTDIPENRELITNNQNGLLVPPKNSTALSTTIQHLIDHPTLMNRLGQKAKKKATNQLSLQQTTLKLANEYHRLSNIQ